MFRLAFVVVLALILVTAFALSRRRNMSSSTAQITGKGYRDITATQLKGLLADAGGPLLVDVREPSEYTAGHIPGTKLIPVGTIAARSAELPKDSDIVLICHAGSRSSQAASILARQGFTKLHNLLGGMTGWSGPVERGAPK